MDVVFHDDLMRLRTGSGPANMATIRHAALNIVKQIPDKRVTYASDGEMAAALADLNRQIAGATDRISVVRIQSSKGL